MRKGMCSKWSHGTVLHALVNDSQTVANLRRSNSSPTMRCRASADSGAALEYCCWPSHVCRGARKTQDTECRVEYMEVQQTVVCCSVCMHSSMTLRIQ
jgi:hypothetical protein